MSSIGKKVRPLPLKGLGGLLGLPTLRPLILRTLARLGEGWEVVWKARNEVEK